MPLRIEDRKVDGVTVVKLSGRLVLGKESASLRDAVKRMASRGDKKILVNLADVNYIDSSGLGTLVGGVYNPGEQQWRDETAASHGSST